MEIKPATGVDIADGEVAVIRHRRHVTATNTRCLFDADPVKLKEEARRRCWSSVELRNLPTRRQHRRMRAYELHGLAPILLNDVNITLKQEGTDSKDRPPPKRNSHITINASTTDAVDGRRRGCLETQDDLETWSTQKVGPIWVSSTEIEPVTGDDISDRDVAMIKRRRHVAVTNTRCLLDVERVKLEGEAFTRNIFGMKTTTQEDV
ncbi:hypothetical protein MRX96_003167 [Rhipicephalus microplus]